MSWGGYIPGSMIREMIEDGTLGDLVDKLYGRDYSEEMEDGTWEGEDEEDVQR